MYEIVAVHESFHSIPWYLPWPAMEPRLFALQDSARLQERAGVAPEAAPVERKRRWRTSNRKPWGARPDPEK